MVFAEQQPSAKVSSRIKLDQSGNKSAVCKTIALLFTATVQDIAPCLCRKSEETQKIVQSFHRLSELQK